MSDPSSGSKPAKSTLPRLLQGRKGTRLYSIAALVERVVDQFFSEHGEGSQALQDARTRGQRLRLLLDSAEYVLAVESVNVTSEDKAGIVSLAYAEVFGYGPLDSLFADPRITTIYLNGARAASVRYGHGELEAVGPIFEDESHLNRIVRRLLEDADVNLDAEPGMVETGLQVNDRPVSLTVAMPPYVAHLTADIRVHPPKKPDFADLIEAEFMTEEAAALIRQMIDSKYGIAIVGEPETGKTTLMSALLGLIPDSTEAVAVERSAELHPAKTVKSLSVKWSLSQPVSYSERIIEALGLHPQLIVLDELRSDEPHMIAPLLDDGILPRMWWSVRGAPDAKRLQSALGMMARRAGPAVDESRVLALYERLPFVLSCARIRGKLQLFSIGEWQSRIDTDYPDLVLLYQYRDGAARPTGNQLARWLDI